jgi:hypothetical protein
MVKVTYEIEKIEGDPLEYLQKKYLKKKEAPIPPAPKREAGYEASKASNSRHECLKTGDC